MSSRTGEIILEVESGKAILSQPNNVSCDSPSEEEVPKAEVETELEPEQQSNEEAREGESGENLLQRELDIEDRNEITFTQKEKDTRSPYAINLRSLWRKMNLHLMQAIGTVVVLIILVMIYLFYNAYFAT